MKLLLIQFAQIKFITLIYESNQMLTFKAQPDTIYRYLAIIPRARMGYESIAHEGERNNCFSKIKLVGQKNIETKHLSQVKARYESFFTAKTLQIWRALFATSGL